MSQIHIRQFILILGLVGSVGAALWVRNQQSEEGSSVVTAVTRESNSPVSASPVESQRLALERLNQRSPEGTDIDPFRAKIWYVALPAPPQEPPPKPTAPQLPFHYAGMSEDSDGGNLMVYLDNGNESITVKPGDQFASVYQFLGIENGKLVIMYLPLSVKQHLSIGQNE